ncbi:hypothetical protein LPJ53_006535, partial [Coemansia erecta]
STSAGAKLAAFGLDRWRVTAPLRAGEANFNVFAYLLHGLSSSKRQQWQLRHGNAQAFAYLAQPQHQRGNADPAHAAQMMDQLRTALVGGDLCTVFLNAHGAHTQRDALARALYHVLFYWLVDQVNRNTSDAEAANHIA